jgi:hypothetical protein
MFIVDIIHDVAWLVSSQFSIDGAVRAAGSKAPNSAGALFSNSQLPNPNHKPGSGENETSQLRRRRYKIRLVLEPLFTC